MSTKNKQQLQSELDKLYAEKQKLVEAKAAFPDKWTDKTQAKLDKLVEDIVDLEEQLELTQDEVPASAPAPTPAPSETPINQQSTSAEEEKYTPAEGTEKMVHLQIVHGRRFNPSTGKEESVPYTQLFTFGEFELFKENHKKLGYSVLKVLYDPFGTAVELITK